MPEYLAALTLVLFIGMVLARVFEGFEKRRIHNDVQDSQGEISQENQSQSALGVCGGSP